MAFEDLFDGFINAENWKELVFAAYSDTTLYAGLIMVVDSIMTKYFTENIGTVEK